MSALSFECKACGSSAWFVHAGIVWCDDCGKEYHGLKSETLIEVSEAIAAAIAAEREACAEMVKRQIENVEVCDEWGDGYITACRAILRALRARGKKNK